MMKKSMAAVFACVVTSVLFADVVINDGTTNWNSPSSYQEQRLPSANENVIIPAGATVTLDASDADSWRIVSNLGRIIPSDAGSKLVVNVGSGEATLSTPFAAQNATANSDVGELVKAGGGTLALGSVGKYSNAENGARCDYYVAVTVNAGTLRLPQNVTTAGNFWYGNVVLGENGTLETISVAAGATIYPNMHVRTLTGSGTVTGTSDRQLQIGGTCTFSGKVTGAAMLAVGGRVSLTGTTSDTSRAMVVQGNYDNLSAENAKGVMFVASFGEKGRPSSIGSAADLETGVWGGGVVYLGSGERTDKNFKVRDQNLYPGYNFIDGGAVGGLEWAGAWTQNEWHGDETKVHRVVVTGSNTTECVMSGAFRNYTQGGNWYPFYVIKQGTGTWRMANNANRTNGGGYAIEEGTLRYDSLAEAGTVCALGKADYLTENYTGKDLDSHRVDYAFLLGSDKGGTMEYTGADEVRCSTRPVAVKGIGGFKVSGSGRFDFAGFSPLEAGADLVLETDRTDGSVKVSKITDGAGGESLSVVKRGAGTMTIDGELSFSGKLKVEEGTLDVKGYGVFPYTWFRWILKEKAVNCARYADIKGNWNNSGADQVLREEMQELALFDENGVRVNRGLSQNATWTAVADLQPGQVTVEGNQPTLVGKLGELYDGVQWKSGSAQWNGMAIYSGSWPGYVKATSASWKTVVERLPDGAGAVVTYDLGYASGTNSASGGYGITAFALEGSCDGVHWTPLVDRDDCEVPGDACRWLSSPDSAANTHKGTSDGNYVTFFDDHVGLTIDKATSETQGVQGTLAEAESIQVAAGAALRATGEVTVKGLTLDAGQNGAFQGIGFASSGVLTIENAPRGRAITPQVDLSACTGVANLANWQVSIGGRIRDNYKVKIGSDGSITVLPPGVVLLVR